MATFVLVPGMWLGGWAWRDVATLLRAAVHTAGLEMAPAAVVRDPERRIAAARHARDELRTVPELRAVDRKVRGAPRVGRREHARAARADRRGIAQDEDLRRPARAALRTRATGPRGGPRHSPRPFVVFRRSASGFAPSVK